MAEQTPFDRRLRDVVAREQECDACAVKLAARDERLTQLEQAFAHQPPKRDLAAEARLAEQNDALTRDRAAHTAEVQAWQMTQTRDRAALEIQTRQLTDTRRHLTAQRATLDGAQRDLAGQRQQIETQAGLVATMQRDAQALQAHGRAAAQQLSDAHTRLRQEQDVVRRQHEEAQSLLAHVAAETQRLQQQRLAVTALQQAVDAEQQHVLAQRTEADGCRSAALHLQRRLETDRTTIQTVQQQQRQEAASLAKQRDDLALRELRVEKCERDVKRLIEKHQLQEELA